MQDEINEIKELLESQKSEIDSIKDNAEKYKCKYYAMYSLFLLLIRTAFPNENGSKLAEDIVQIQSMILSNHNLNTNYQPLKVAFDEIHKDLQKMNLSQCRE